MAESTPTPEQIDDTLNQEDTDVLRYVLETTRGVSAVSLYNQSFADEDTNIDS